MNSHSKAGEAIKLGTLHPGFPVYVETPAGCAPWPVTNDRHEPQLHAGDWAMIDTTRRTIEHGVLFLIAHRCRDLPGSKGVLVLWQVCEEAEILRRGRKNPAEPHVWRQPLDRPRSYEDLERRIETGRRARLSNGPFRRAFLESPIASQAIGVFDGRHWLQRR